MNTFQNFMSVLPIEGLNKLCVLTNYVTPKIYESFAECATYDEAIQTLEALFAKPTNEIFARHLLATPCQHAGKTLDEYLQALKTLSKDCNFKSVTAALHREESIRDAFISGLQSSLIRQRLLENKTCAKLTYKGWKLEASLTVAVLIASFTQTWSDNGV